MTESGTPDDGTDAGRDGSRATSVPPSGTDVAARIDEREVGGTPLVELDLDVAPTVYAKAEWFNLGSLAHGGGSVKTRIGRAMVDAAEAAGELPGDTIIEASSGNTAAALARIGAARGHDVEVVMPDDAGAGKVAAVEDAGGAIRFVDSELGYDAFVEHCRAVVAEREDYAYPNQYDNPANPGVHAGTTGPEIWHQSGGAVDHFVAGTGTGGTLVGVAHALGPRGVTVHGYEPAETMHDIAGLKHLHHPEEFVPGVYEESVLATVDTVATGTAKAAARDLWRRHRDTAIRVVDPGRWSRRAVEDGLRVDGEFVVGPSSGGCVEMVRRLDDRGAFDADETVVIPLPDRGDRYPERDLWADVL